MRSYPSDTELKHLTGLLLYMLQQQQKSFFGTPSEHGAVQVFVFVIQSIYLFTAVKRGNQILCHVDDLQCRQ